MANKIIRICDRCKSYIESERDVWPIRLYIEFPAARSAYKQDDLIEIQQFKIITGRTIEREVCTECAKEVTEEYLLAERNPADKLFDGFKPPVTDLQKKITDYTD